MAIMSGDENVTFIAKNPINMATAKIEQYPDDKTANNRPMTTVTIPIKQTGRRPILKKISTLQSS